MPSFSTLYRLVSSTPVMAAFVWTENIGRIVTTALLSMVPTFEGRYAIAAGLAMGMPVVFTFILAFLFSTIPMPFIFWLFKPIIHWALKLPFKPVAKFANWLNNRVYTKAKQLNGVGMWALFVFVAVPLPGTGVWTGSMIATLLEMDKKRASVAIVAGNFCACLIMTLLSMGVLSFF